MAIRVVEFSSRWYKIRKIFAEESTYPNYWILSFELMQMASCQKKGIILAIKSFKNWFYQKMSLTQNVLLNWYSSIKKSMRKIQVIFRILTLKVKFWHFLTACHSLIQNSKFNHFLWVCWFLYPPFENSTTHNAIT